MMRQERAKQFMPFDAMKGLQEALRDREERHSRTEKRIICEEDIERNCALLQRIKKGARLRVEHYASFHDVVSEGTVTELNFALKYLKLGEEKIFFDDIYIMKIID